MPVIVKKFRVNTGEEIFYPGDVVQGLDEDTEQQLVDAGICEYPPVIISGTVELTVGPKTIEEFTNLNAAGQKELLESLEIQPGANEKERIQQYTDWLASDALQPDGGNGSPADDTGPKTGLPE